jgi:hypothetical protein
MARARFTRIGRVVALVLGLAAAPLAALADPPAPAPAPAVTGLATPPTSSPSPLLGDGQAVTWWFAYKFNSASFPTAIMAQQTCRFGGLVQHKAFSQHYALASNADPVLRTAGDDIGESPADPLGATFAEIYGSGLNYVVWNDQLYDHPKVKGDGSWGHSKGILAWNGAGEGFILQVTTPSWPGSGSADFPRQGSGNTLGCIETPNNLSNAQHFFALKLSHDDLLRVLDGLAAASVITADPALGDLPPADPGGRDAHQLIRNGGPDDVRARVDRLGRRSHETAASMTILSSGVVLIVKPSDLNVPPWQLVSAELGAPLRTATWWASPRIPSAHAGPPGCWSTSLAAPGEVQVATTGHWEGKEIKLIGGSNHAKLGVSLDPARPYVIFGDMNQQGALVPKAKGGKGACASSQNGRGGLFFAIENAPLAAGLKALMDGETAPYALP